MPGTGGWQSPELCKAILEEQSKKKRKKAFDFLPWGDLFSLGVVFYECLTGEHPFDTSLPDELLLAEVAFEKPIHPVRLSSAVPLGLNKVVMKLLEKQSKARYRDGAEVADDLRRLLKKVKDKRWAKPFKQPVPDEEEAPVLSLVSVLVPPEPPVPVDEKESEVPMPDTPHSEPPSVDTGASAEAEASPRDPLVPPSVQPDASPHSADTDVLLSNEVETAEPRGLPESERAMGTVLDLGKAGAYTLEQRLGRGGMGEVHLARQVRARGFSQFVAIKRLRPGRQGWEERSFADEARVLSLLHHPNIARVYDFFELEGNPYLVMEYIEGDSLHSLLELARRKGRRFSESVACAVMAEVADALHYAHHVTDEAGQPLHIVHRDVSPTNILITPAGRVVLVDFGVARSNLEGRTATRTGATFIKGKAPYLSPEQVKRLPLDSRSDLFAVGTILVEMLTGKAPFGWTADHITLRCIEAVTPEYVASLLDGVSEPLRALCQKLLAFSPDQRFATGREVATALRHHAGLGEGQQSIQSEVEKLQALPDTSAPPAIAVTAARALVGVKRARRAVALVGALVLAALVIASWYVPRDAAVPALSSPPREGSVVASSRPPEKPIAPASPVPPTQRPSRGKPKREDSLAVAAGPARRRVVVAADEPQQGKKESERGSTTHEAERQGGDAAGGGRLAAASTPPSTASTNAPADAPSLGRDGERQVAGSREQPATTSTDFVRVYGEATSPEHNLAALLAADRADLTALLPLPEAQATSPGALSRGADLP